VLAEVAEMAAHSHAIDYVFVLRFWRESAGDKLNTGRWRARISEVNTKRQFHAKGIDNAFGVVRALLSSDGENGPGIGNDRVP
jgi:hypothetical protein